MIPSYTPATRKQLEGMSDEQLLSQYQSLVDLIRETEGIPFERNPQLERDKLIRLIDAGQKNYLNDVLAGSLIAWGERTGNLDKPIFVSGGQK